MRGEATVRVTMESVKNKDRQIAFLRALAALLVTVIVVIAFALVRKHAEPGWIKDFVVAVLPNVAIVSGVYAALYFALSDRGLTPEQQLAESVSAGVARRLDLPAIVEQVRLDTEEPDWPTYLAEADRVVVAARSLARWSTNNAAALDEFFRRGGKMEVFSHDPQREANIEFAAASHAGYGERQPERVRSNVRSGLYRIRLASNGTAAIRYVTDDAFVFTVALFALYRKGNLERVVLRPVENVRAGVTQAPVFVLRADPDGKVAGFVDRELAGLRRISRELGSEDAAALDD